MYRPEIIYLHALTLVAIGIDPLFGDALAGIQSTISGLAAIQPAAIKTYGRMVGKMAAANDHRYA